MTLRCCGVAIALLSASWGGLDVRAAEAQCTYSVSPLTFSALSTGQSASISVITGGLCTWTATSTVPWITITSGATMTGLGSANYTVAANTSGTTRTGILNVAGQTVTVTQSANSCSYNVSPTSVSVVPTGMNGSIAVITGGLCPWTAVSAVPWIVITGGASMTGLGSASYSVGPTTVARVGTLTVAGQTVTITQGGSAQPPTPPANLRIIDIRFDGPLLSTLTIFGRK
jgi:hypothetical protein